MKLKVLKEDLEKYRTNREKQVLLLTNGNLKEAQEMSTVLQSQLHEKIRIQIYELEEVALLEANEQLISDQNQARASILVFVIIGLVALVLSFFMIVILNKTVAKPLNDIAIMATTIASGDLSVEVSSTYRTDEVGRLKLAFNDMVNNLKESIKDISEGVVALGSSSSEILAATSQVSASAIETATAISQTSTTVEEVRQASQLSSEKAGRVAQNAQETASVTQTGIEAVGKTIEVMQIVQNQMEAITKTIVRLSEQSQQIGGIIASVNDVADQSTLLAVNAAIEASKAGEQGKGFTVVAQEIKNLSLRSKKATTQVRNILSDVQKATTAAVMSTEQGTKAVADAVSQSTQAGETIHILSKSVNEFLQAAAQIVASNQQQVVGMDQVGLAMNSINQAGAENAASMKQAENSAKDLNELGIKLKLLVDQYKM
jgi:methyl-accepting chemotaxis protein